VALTGSGVIFALVVVAWLCYLVPLTLRRHDEAVRSRSVDRFSTAMRVLGRTDGTGTAGTRGTPGRRGTAASTVGPSGPRRSSRRPGGTQPAPRPLAHRRAAQVAAAARRRRVLIVLLLVTTAATVGAWTGWVPLWSPAVPVAAVVGFVLLARWQVNRARTAAWEQKLRASARAAATRTSAELPAEVTPPAGGVPVPAMVTGRTTPRPSAADLEVPGSAPAAPQVTPVAAVAPETEPEIEPVAVPPAWSRDEAPSLWDPLPVTLPTYVSKPRAERGIRTIDLTGAGTRSSGRPNDGQAAGVVAGAGPQMASRRAAEAASGPAVPVPGAVARRAVGD